ncbi:unnamed protein product [Lymnaea stagnalis]|uniref:SAM-dependent MTase RsmB/NOP-type domain-containing protein n=1 Tax=Lymnaea stagnalis TaxID=6523 RepID=A0AAV2HVB5_LYMST
MNIDLFISTAKVLKKASKKEASLKTLIYESQYEPISQLFALVNEILKYRDLLEEILSHCPNNGFMEEEIIKGDKQMAIALTYEQLLGRKFGRNVGLRKCMLKYRGDLRAAVEKVVKAHNVKTLRDIIKSESTTTEVVIPRYMRVNFIKTTTEDVIKELQTEGWEYVGKIEIESFKESVLALTKNQFGLDPILNDLLVFPVGTNLYNHNLTVSGVLIQQDKASCIPAHVLSPLAGSVVLDCCASPGNKTSHLASLMKDKGRIVAVDRDFKRMSTMSRLLERSGVTCVELVHQDFLTVQPSSEDAKNITMILVDPSCSGSGRMGTQQGKDDYSTDKKRLETLKLFQISILKHAFRFPNVKRVVYSTCSVHEEENEQVVEEILSHVSDYFKCVHIFPEWACHRGIAGYPHSECFLRLSPEHDLTQGFFVACFERVKEMSDKVGKIRDSEKNCHEGDALSTGKEQVNDCAQPDNGAPSDDTRPKEKRKHRKDKRKRKDSESLNSKDPTEHMKVCDNDGVTLSSRKKLKKETELLHSTNEEIAKEGVRSQKKKKSKKDKKRTNDDADSLTSPMKSKNKYKIVAGEDDCSLTMEDSRIPGSESEENVSSENVTAKKKKKKRDKEKEASLEAIESYICAKGDNSTPHRKKNKSHENKDATNDDTHISSRSPKTIVSSMDNDEHPNTQATSEVHNNGTSDPDGELKKKRKKKKKSKD